jgi:hypothetical protein
MRSLRPKTERRALERRAAAPPRSRALALFAFAPLVLVQCTALLGLDGRTDAVAELCQVVDLCYATSGPYASPCEQHLGGKLSSAESATQKEWLEKQVSAACGASCSDARGCLDREPLCSTPSATSGCLANEECCGFSRGAVVCGPLAAASLVAGGDPERPKGCCLPLGAVCTAGAGPCCDDTGGCDTDVGTCGGVVCAGEAAPCEFNFQCCTGVCNRDEQGNGTCSAEPCRPDGFQCASDNECCSQFCGPSGACETPACTVRNQPCTVEGGTNECCAGLACLNVLATTTTQKYLLCTDPDQPNCYPAEYDCASHNQCCADDPAGVCPNEPGKAHGFCDPEYHRCGACRPGGSPCANDASCCSGVCDPSGTCTEAASGCVEVGGCCTSNDDCCAFQTPAMGAPTGGCLNGTCE